MLQLYIGNTYIDSDYDLIKIIAQLDPFNGELTGAYIGQFVGSNTIFTYNSNGETITGYSNIVSEVLPGQLLWKTMSVREQYTLVEIAKELMSKKITAIKITRTLLGCTLVEAKNIIEDLQGNYHGGFTNTKKDLSYE